MARFSEQFGQQVKQATDIIELIGQYVALTKKGREFVGLCPFHDDHNPSMRISPVKQIYKCFSCGAGGDVFTFMTEYEKLSFPEAVRTLAERANIPIPTEYEPRPAEGGADKSSLQAAMMFAAQFYRRQLNSDAGKAALDYALSRGLSDESIKRFGLGFAPESWEALLGAARRKGFGESVLLAAGLITRRESGSGCYDRFRNRLMFPIIDLTGKVVAFGGRALGTDEQAKYLNSPDTPLFDKSNLLYAMNWSRDAIRTGGRAVVVEGYLDALIPLQAGVENVVATMGTALTDRHARLLSRFADEAVLIFDADVAGAAAAERALEVFIAQQLHVRVATIPAGKDPCDFCLAEGADALTQLIDTAPDAMQYVLDRRMVEYEAAGGNLADRRRIVEDFLRLIVSSAAYGAIDELRRGQLAQHVGHMLNISAGDLQQQMRRLARRLPPAATGGAPRAASSGPAGQPTASDAQRSPSGGRAPLAERHVMEVLLNDPELFDQAAERIDPGDFSDYEMRAIAGQIWRLGEAGRLHLDQLMTIEDLAPLASLITDLVDAGEQRGNYEPTLTGAVDDLVRRRENAEVEKLRASTDDDALRKLTDHYRQSDPRRWPKIS
ncbi:MAG: DNA primase [Planctomycetota bacterium]